MDNRLWTFFLRLQKTSLNSLSIIYYPLSIIPIFAGLFYALLYSFGIVGALSTGFTLQYWQAVLSAPEFLSSLFTSVFVSGVSIILSRIIALTIAIPNPNKTKAHSSSIIYHSSLFYLPLSIPPIIAAFLSLQWLGNSGMLSRLGFSVGIFKSMDAFPELVNDKFYLGVIATQVLMTFPFFTLFFLNAYKNDNLENFEFLSQTLGATNFQTRRKIIIPMLLHKARPSIILFFISLMSAYEIPLLLGRQSPMFLSVLMAQKFKKFNLLDIPQAYVMTVIYAAIVLILVRVFLKKRY